MGEKEMPSQEEVESAGQTLVSIRMLLELVSMDMLKAVLDAAQSGRVRYQTLGPMLDPTEWQLHGQDRERDYDTQIAAARALIDLKKAWRQDVPMDQRIQEELDRGAPKEEDVLDPEMVEDVKGGEGK